MSSFYALFIYRVLISVTLIIVNASTRRLSRFAYLDMSVIKIAGVSGNR
jgi:hypothetical protein